MKGHALSRLESSSRRMLRVAIVAVLCCHVCMIAWSASQLSPVYDEIGHLGAGLSHLRFGRFDLYAVNPPLVRTLAAIPVAISNPRENWNSYRTEIHGRPEFRVGRDFIQANRSNWFQYFMFARWACIPFSIVGALSCYFWAESVDGAAAGFIAMLLWCFSPNVLGNGCFITPDVGAASLGCAAMYCFSRFLQNPTWSSSLSTGLFFGFALLAKFTWVFLFPLLPVVWLLNWQRTHQSLYSFIPLSFILVVALIVLDIGYGFEDVGEPLGDFQFSSSTLSGQPANAGVGRHRNRFHGTVLGRIPVPLPRNMVRGMDYLKWEFETRKWSYLAGEHRFGGWWYYYLYAAAIKVPIGTLALCVVGAASMLREKSRFWTDFSPVFFPALMILIAVSSQTGFNHHLRYILPAFPFMFIVAACGAVRLGRSTMVGRIIAAFALAWTIGAGLWIYPHGMAYFNEIVGGPRNGAKYLAFSNIDWGQGMFLLKAWQENNPGKSPLFVATSSYLDHEVFGIRGAALYSAAQFQPQEKVTAVRDKFPPGWYAIGVSRLLQPNTDFSVFMDIEPEYRLGYSINVYHLTEPIEVNRGRSRNLANP